MVRTPHYLKVNRKTSTPKYLCFVDTETLPQEIPNGQRHFLSFGWALFLRIDNGKETTTNRPKWVRFDTAIDFWKACDDFINPKTKLYIFAHNWGFDGAILKADIAPLDLGYECLFFPLDSPAFFMTIKNKESNKTMTLIDSTNYFKQSLSSLGDMIGQEKLAMPAFNDSIEIWDKYCMNDVIVLSKAILSWIEYVKEYDLGSFSVTLPAQAFNAFKHRFMPIEILIHNDDYISELERRSYSAGRTDVFFQGTINDDVYYLDVNSLYPSVMKDNPYPYFLSASGESLSIKELEKLLLQYAVIADVYLNTDQDCYPLKTNERLLFPLGKFRTTLTTPQLIHAIKNNHIISVSNWASYCHEIYFNEYVEFFYNERLRFKDSGNITYSLMAKLFLNSLYGKFGQRSTPWEDIGLANPDDEDHEVIINIDTQEYQEFKSIMGRRFKRLPTGESMNSFPAIAAHVCGYARVKMWDLMEYIGRENIFYTDTDSIFTNKKGYDLACKGLIGSDIGLLKLEQISNQVSIYNPKDYRFGDDRKIKGIKKSAIKIDDNKYSQIQFTSWNRHRNRGESGFIDIMNITKEISTTYKKGIVTPSGWIKPFILND